MDASAILKEYNVTISGLKKAEYLNGQTARLCGGKAKPGRYGCQLNDESVVSIHRSNLDLVNPRKREMIELRRTADDLYGPGQVGLFAKEDIEQGTFLFKGGVDEDAEDENDGDVFWRFSMNSSCFPNVFSTGADELQRDGKVAEYFSAIRDIKKGEELVRDGGDELANARKERKQRPVTIPDDYSDGKYECKCTLCRKTDMEVEDDSVDQTAVLAGYVYNLVSGDITNNQISKDDWSQVKRFLNIPNNKDPVKAIFGLFTNRDLYPRLVKLMESEHFPYKNDEDLYAHVKKMYIQMLIMFGFPNPDNVMKSEHNIENIDNIVGEL